MSLLWWNWKDYDALKRGNMLAWDGDMVYSHTFPEVMQRQSEGIYLLADPQELFNIKVNEWFWGTIDQDIEKYIKKLLK